MSGEIEAFGGLVDAGLVARSVGGAGRAPGNIDAAAIADAHDACANCGAALAGNFCGNCGQKAHLHRSLLHVGEEFLHGITHFDGKAWTTLPMLLFRPGTLTREYIMGRRSRYIAPVPLFLLVVFSMFFVFSFISVKGGAAGDEKPMTRAEAVKALPGIETELAEMDRKLAAATRAGNSADIAVLRTARAGVIVARDRVAARSRGEISSPLDLADAARRAVDDGNLTVEMGEESLNIKVRKALENPELVLYKIQSKAYKFSFLLVPLSLPWLWLVFALKRGVRMYDHAIFALYSISFMSLLFMIGSIALNFDVVNEAFWTVLVGSSFVHLFYQLKGAYALTGGGAAWRTVALSFFAPMTLGVYAVLMLILGLVD